MDSCEALARRAFFWTDPFDASSGSVFKNGFQTGNTFRSVAFIGLREKRPVLLPARLQKYNMGLKRTVNRFSCEAEIDENFQGPKLRPDVGSEVFRYWGGRQIPPMNKITWVALVTFIRGRCLRSKGFGPVEIKGGDQVDSDPESMFIKVTSWPS